MLQNLSVALTIATFPVRLLWRGYRGLAWAFDAPTPRVPAPALDPAPAADATADKSANPIAPSGTLPERARERLLKLGFATSTILWAPAAYLAAGAHRLGWISTPGAWTGFAWTAALLWLLSVVAIRRAGRREAAARAASPLASVRRAVGTVAAMPARAVGGVRAAGVRVASAPSRVREAARSYLARFIAARTAPARGSVVERQVD